MKYFSFRCHFFLRATSRACLTYIGDGEGIYVSNFIAQMYVIVSTCSMLIVQTQYRLMSLSL